MLLKKSLSVFLVFFIIFSLFFTTALAEGAEDDKLTAESSEEPVEPNEFITEQESLSSWLES